MNKKEAIQAMLDGETVSNSHGDKWNMVDLHFVRMLNHDAEFTPKDINLMCESGYEIHQTPKPKVKMWQWVVKHKNPIFLNSRPLVTEELFEDEDKL